MRRITVILLITLLLSACSSAQVKRYGIRVVNEYPHDRTSFTQGIFFHEGRLYETTGEYGESSLRIVDLKSGKATSRLDFDRRYFVEGSTVMGGELYILTWMNNVAFRYDPATLEYKSSSRYPRQGWGLTTDGRRLIASDGTSTLRFLDNKLKVTGELKVTIQGKPLRNLNELEWIDGSIWANVWMTDTIVIINPSNGKVEATIDCTGLLPSSLRHSDTDVLNGIATHSGRIYLTGKRWPRLYEIELVEL